MIQLICHPEPIGGIDENLAWKIQGRWAGGTALVGQDAREVALADDPLGRCSAQCRCRRAETQDAVSVELGDEDFSRRRRDRDTGGQVHRKRARGSRRVSGKVGLTEDDGRGLVGAEILGIHRHRGDREQQARERNTHRVPQSHCRNHDARGARLFRFLSSGHRVPILDS